MDAQAIRADFPVLQTDRPPVYLDSACTTLKPRQVLDQMAHYHEAWGACAGRSVHRLGTEVTLAVEEARERVAAFIGAAEPGECIFTKNTTEAVNLVAYAFPFQPGDVVVGTDKEHNSNLVPWLHQDRRGRLDYRAFPAAADGTVDLDAFHAFLEDAGQSGQRLRMVSLGHVSNVDGVTLPAREISKLAHDLGALVFWDGAQGAPHSVVDVQDIGADLYAWSMHKMMGPSLGVLYGRADVLESMDGFLVGGSTVADVRVDDYQLLGPPERFEAGLQDNGAIIGAGAACDYLNGLGRQEVHDHEVRLNRRVDAGLRELPGVEIVGPTDAAARGGITGFNLAGLSSHDVALYLDEAADIAVRSGHHCCHAYFHARGVDGCVRSSLYAYNTEEDVDRLLAAVGELAAALPN